MDDRDAVPDRRVVQEVAGGEVVGAVDDHVPALAEDPVDVLGGEALAEDLHADVGVERLDRALRRFGLRLAEALGRVDDLALEVRVVDDVVVDDPDRPDPCRGEIERRGRAEAAGSDQEDPRVEEAELPLLADLGDEEVASSGAASTRRARAAGRSRSRCASTR